MTPADLLSSAISLTKLLRDVVERNDSRFQFITRAQTPMGLPCMGWGVVVAACGVCSTCTTVASKTK